MIRRLALVIALLLTAVPAHAGYTLDGSNDRIDIGTVAGFGSQIRDSDGWSIGCWVSTTLATQNTVMMAMTTGAQGASPNNQEFQFGLQETWASTDFGSSANSLLWDFGDKNNNGPLYRTTAGITLQNTGVHHHMLTVAGATGSPSGSSTNGSVTAHWYVDNVDRSTWTKDFILGTDAMADYVNTLAIGAERKNGGTWFNWNAGVYYDCRAYDIALTAPEVNDIFVLGGRDTIKHNLLRRWPLQGSCIETMKNDTCTPQNGPTLTTVQELYGVRRR